MSNSSDKTEQHPSPESDLKPERKTATATSSPSKSPKTPRKSVTREAGEWTPEKRAKFFDHIIAAGARSTDLGAFAAELGLNALQLRNQVQAARKSNFPYRAVRYIAGEEEKDKS